MESGSKFTMFTFLINVFAPVLEFNYFKFGKFCKFIRSSQTC